MKKNIREMKVITNDFYSHFCGVNLSEVSPGIHFVCTEERNKQVKGFGCKYTIYVLVKENLCVVSYAPQYADFIEKFKTCNVEELLSALNGTYRFKIMQLMIIEEERVQEYGNARILKESDYPLYETFFCQTSPAADPADWLQDYFKEKVAKEYFAGYFENDVLVSVCDAPDMPYMEDIIQHTGIVTLKDEQRKGYAKCTAALATHHLMEKGICPQWECHIENMASIALAQSIGYEKYGVAYVFAE